MEIQKRWPGWLKGLMIGILISILLSTTVFFNDIPIRNKISGVLTYGLLFGFIGLVMGRIVDVDRAKKDQTQTGITAKNYWKRGGIIGLIAAAILAVTTVFVCDTSCWRESPVYLGVVVAFPVCYLIGGFAGTFWNNRRTRIIMLVIVAVLIVLFFAGRISEFSG